MNYKEFTETIKDKLTGTFGSGYRVYAQEVLIGNGQKRIGICVLKDGERPISPVIYLEKYYAASRSGETMEDIMPRIVDEIKAGQENAGICFRVLCGITDWDFVKDSIYPFLLSRDRNEEMCRVYAGRPMLDLQIFYVIRCEVPEMGTKYVRVKKSLMERWGVSEDKVYEQAMTNLRFDGYKVKRLGTILKEMLDDTYMDLPDDISADELEGETEMLVLTNREKCYGDAGLLLGRDFFNEAMGGRNFYILPSSVHELILVPGERMADEYRLTQMVREVNRETVLNEEVLADHVYYYDMAVGLMAL